MDEPNPAEADMDDAAEEARPSDALDTRVGPAELPLEPGDSDLADAWWAQSARHATLAADPAGSSKSLMAKRPRLERRRKNRCAESN
jgi:hypothetical protein